jgi:hypothetical protein
MHFFIINLGIFHGKFQILGHTIHQHVIEDEYAARVSNLQMYDALR